MTPVLREDYAVLPNGKVAIALGDAHSVVDPVVRQGANSASYSAWELATPQRTGAFLARHGM